MSPRITTIAVAAVILVAAGVWVVAGPKFASLNSRQSVFTNLVSNRSLSGGKCSLNGTVVSNAGNPVVAAMVCATPIGLARSSVTNCVRSDSDGRYRLVDLFPEDYRIVGSAPEFGISNVRNSVALKECSGLRDFDVVLGGQGSKLAGHVRNSRGVAIANATLRVIGAGTEAGFTSGATSDARGAFEIWGPAGQAWIEAKAEGYATVKVATMAPNSAVDIVLVLGATLSGNVMTRFGYAVGGVTVRAVPAEMIAHEAAPSALSDAAGHFGISGLPPGIYRLRAEAPHWQGAGKYTVDVGMGQHIDDLLVEVTPGVQVTARVSILPSHKSCAQGHVVLASTESNQSPSLRNETIFSGADQMSTSFMQSDGTIRFDGVAPGRYAAHIECYGYRYREAPPLLELGEGDVSNLEWAVVSAPSVKIMVADEQGHAVNGANVGLLSKDNGYIQALQRGNGEYVILGVPSGVYKAMSVDSPALVGEAGVPVSVTEDTDDIEVKLVLAGSSRIQVDVRRKDATPSGGLQVYAIGLDKDPSATSESEAMFQAVDQGGGRYAIEPLRAGAYRVQVSDGRNPPMVQEVAIGAGESRNLDLQLDYSATLRGTVTTTDGKPLAYVLVSARASNVMPTLPMKSHERVAAGQAVLTNEQGRFEIAGLIDAAEFAVTVERGGGIVGIRERVSPRDVVEFVIPSTRSISGRIVDENNHAVSNYQLQILNSETGAGRSLSVRDPNGLWAFDDVAPGLIVVSAFDDMSRTAEKNVEVPIDRDVTGLQLVLKASTAAP